MLGNVDHRATRKCSPELMPPVNLRVHRIAMLCLCGVAFPDSSGLLESLIGAIGCSKGFRLVTEWIAQSQVDSGVPPGDSDGLL